MGSGVCVALIGKIVSHPCKCVDGMDVRAKFLRNQAPDRKVFVVLAGEFGAGLVGVGRHRGG